MKVFTTVLLIANITHFACLEEIGDKGSRKQTKSVPKSTKLPACQACKMLVESFKLQLKEKTEQFGSDKDEENSVTFNGVEIVNNILTNLCRKERAKDQCHSMVDKCKEDIQNWWLNDRKHNPDLLHYLCITKLHYCCPNGHYGPNCYPCPGFPEGICNNNGKCKGNGTRKGNGECICDVGYTGKTCNECAPSYYVSYKDKEKMLCSRCHSACDGNCTRAGAKGCTACRDGWRMDKARGCVDVNECFSKRSPCKRNEFCINNEGSYSCLACDLSCDTCTGDGPDMCEKCAMGFILKDNICVNEKEYVTYSDITRYITYAGLCFATYIIFQNNPWIASAIGLCVAVYVTVSEYLMGTLTAASFTRLLERLEHLWRDV